jgi:hypothetical protein
MLYNAYIHTFRLTENEQDGQCTYKRNIQALGATIFAVEKQQLIQYML